MNLNKKRSSPAPSRDSLAKHTYLIFDVFERGMTRIVFTLSYINFEQKIYLDWIIFRSAIRFDGIAPAEQCKVNSPVQKVVDHNRFSELSPKQRMHNLPLRTVDVMSYIMTI